MQVYRCYYPTFLSLIIAIGEPAKAESSAWGWSPIILEIHIWLLITMLG